MNKNKQRISLFDIINYFFLGILAFVSIFPFYNVLVTSFSSYDDFLNNTIILFPRRISFDSYRDVFLTTFFAKGLQNTIIVTFAGVLYNMLLSVTLAYALSKKYLAGRNIFMNLIVFTMFFSGGIIPYYILVTNVLHLRDSLIALILPTGINTFYMIVMKNYFSSLPVEFDEAPKIDGANDLQVLLKVILPVSRPIIATFMLFYAVDRWNEWFNAMLFLRTKDLFTLQLVLRNLIVRASDVNSQQLSMNLGRPVFPMAIKCASVVLTVLPIMCVYPFLQKHFAKGIMIGAIKS